jgi:uncharacterized linocin/CFP29 family protein
MPDDNPLPWTGQQWDELRSVALEAARKSRVASTFLPLVGPLPADQVTVASNWMRIPNQRRRLTGEARNRLDVRTGKTLQLVTLACNLYLRGSEISDPHLDAAKSMVRRAGEVLGRLEDAVVFSGLPQNLENLRFNQAIQPKIYTLTGGRDLTGLLQAPDTVLYDEATKTGAPKRLRTIRKAGKEYIAANGKKKKKKKRRAAMKAYKSAEMTAKDQLMCVGLGKDPTGRAVVNGVVDAIQRLEARGHFGPFGVVLGHELFRVATNPSKSLVLPTDRLAEFLDGRRVLRSGVLPSDRGVVVALGAQPIELVVASDIDIRFLQATLEPRYVLRVFERLVLRIKELDAVCCVTSNKLLLEPGFEPRRAQS